MHDFFYRPDALPVGWYNFRNGTERNGTAERTVIGRNGTPILTLKITVIYAIQLPNVFRKLIVTFCRVP